MTEKTGTEEGKFKNCGDCGCGPCMCGVPGFVTYRGYTREEALASVGPGWAELINDLFDAKPDDTQVVQVKEKFGGLRFYLAGGPSWYRLTVRGAESASVQTCETCGKYGDIKTPGGNPHGWYRTVCDTCHPEDDYKKPETEAEKLRKALGDAHDRERMA